MTKELTNKEVDIQNSAERIAILFGRSVGLHLKATDKEGKILNQGTFDSIQQETLSLLRKGWTVTELKERIQLAYKEFQKEDRIGALVTGCVPEAVKKSWDRNLIEITPRRYHKELQEVPRRMPVVRVTQTDRGPQTTTTHPWQAGKLKTVYTVKDLNRYWNTLEYRVLQPVDQINSPILWVNILERYDVSDILWAIDEIPEAATNWPSVKLIRIFDLEPLIQMDLQQTDGISVYFMDRTLI